MSSTSAASLEHVMKAITDIKDKQITKEYFDGKFAKLEEAVRGHGTNITSIENHLIAVESNTTDLSIIYKELYEKERRKNNVVLFNFPELPSSTPTSTYYKKEKLQINECFAKMGIYGCSNDQVKMSIRRLGKPANPGCTLMKPRPLKITFTNSVVRDEVLAAAIGLKGDETWGDVVITADLTKKQQEMEKKRKADNTLKF